MVRSAWRGRFLPPRRSRLTEQLEPLHEAGAPNSNSPPPRGLGLNANAPNWSDLTDDLGRHLSAARLPGNPLPPSPRLR